MASIPNWLVVILGMGVVFLGLICLVILLSITGALLGKKKDAIPKTVIPREQPIENRREIIAAVAAVLAEELGTDVQGLRIVSFKRI